VTTAGDCDDGDGSIEPGATEVCDDLDNDCDGRAEEGLTFTSYYYDGDGDGSGGQLYARLCSAPGGGTVSVAGDCDDGAGAIEPGATELCDDIDNDCDGVAEDGLTFLPYFHDDDGDGYGAAYYGQACVDPGGSTAGTWGDCLDTSDTAYPGATELCDGIDNDCDGPPDEGCP
jgi:hypothetical protein